ncbi:radical SAM/SPASM domain-containing protein [candidate division MSBL1 archaeon SCGC-AAA259M10]|uniref:Radical SAM/SPASM domain-containing protein n=2 Tax=candidate division MSBL1 TaxID=215777 RepID=A0A133U3R9_9EURY|nr:radical SAM/SPASM domain-containing protein [candidate division MSBL1 archaeon SCGC-AAA259B11]KXA99935.1 radical SAM/SPASM domain-containing protein [candidate division MSBL1 archaeon SCGC-AAA259M10]
MIGVSKLLWGLETESDGLRYEDPSSKVKQIKHEGRHRNKPVVVWNATVKCNLSCRHCYSSAKLSSHPSELTTAEAKGLIDDLHEFGTPVLLFSGGEPLMRDDIFELIDYASGRGLRTVLSTNGTLLSSEITSNLVEAGVDYVGVSIDGLEETNDEFRGQEGAFRKALRGIKNCIDAGVKVGLRYTITRYNAHQLEEMIDLLREEGVDRYCFYHLAYSGRGEEIQKHDLSKNETRERVRSLFTMSLDLYEQGEDIEILTVGNYVDAPFLYLYAKEKLGENRAKKIYTFLKRNGGDGTGETIADIDFRGNVHPNQFWRDYTFGNIRNRPFQKIWTDTSDPVMKGLKNKEDYLKGKCANCRFLKICKGGSRVRALKVKGDIWAPDPKCYLFKEEISG